MSLFSSNMLARIAPASAPWGNRSRFDAWHWMLLGVVATGIALRAYDLTAKSFWFDEAYVYWVSVGSVSDLVRRHQEYHVDPPMIGLAVNLVSRLADGAEWIRIIPFFFGAVSVVAFALFSRQWIGTVGATFSAAFMALSYNQIAYSREASEYSLLLLLTVLALWITPWPGQKFTRKRIYGLAAVWFLSPFCAYGMLFTLSAISITWIMFWAMQEKNSREDLFKWIAVQTSAIPSSFIVYNLFLSHQLAGTKMPYLEEHYWPGGGLYELSIFLSEKTISIANFAYSGKDLFLTVFVFGFLLFIMSNRLRYFAVTFLLMIILLLLFSWLKVYPLYGGRQTIFLSPLLYLFSGGALAWFVSSNSRAIRILTSCVAVVLLSAGMRSSIFYHRFEGNENIKQVGHALTERRLKQDAVFVHPLAGPAFFAHFPELGGEVYRPSENPMDTIFKPGAEEHWASDFGRLVSRNDRIWLVLSHNDEREIETFLSLVPEDFRLSEITDAQGSILMFLQRMGDRAPP